MPDIVPASLILTTLNEGKTVQIFFESLIHQTVFPAEIVVCDGGSTDKTLELLFTVERHGIPIHIHTETGATIARGRNHAIEHSLYDILVVSDCGCILHSDWLEKITLPLLMDPSCEVVAGGYVLEGKTYFQKIASAAEIPVAEIPERLYLPSSRSFALRKKSWQEVGGYPEDLSFAGEDTALCMQLKAAGKKFITQRDARVTWFPRVTLHAYIKQHYFYGVGDGESRMKTTFYVKIFFKNFLALTILSLGFLIPPFFILFPLSAASYFFYLYPLYHWRNILLLHALAAFFLILIKEWSATCGWLRGLLRAKR